MRTLDIFCLCRCDILAQDYDATDDRDMELIVTP